MATTAQHEATLPTRTATAGTDYDDAIPDEDASEVTKLFHERLQAWKHACGYLEDYVTATEKLAASNGKEYEKVLKTVSTPLKEGHHFETTVGGVAGLFENIRTNTQGLANSNAETAKTLKGTILPIFERLHAEIKHKTKELTKGAGKGSKAVDKARTVSQKHIELLGQQTASFDSNGSVKAHEDPYLLQRQVHHRLHKQVIEENNIREDMLAVQSNFSQFEAHVLQTLQSGIAQFNQVVSGQAEHTRTLYGDITAHVQRIPADHEWNAFVTRNAGILIDPTAPKRAVGNIAFANQDHRASRPLIAGSLERKQGLLKKYDASYYVVTPSKYLHEFKTDDDFAKDPSPENSLYLPDCLIGAVDGAKFNVRGKDSSKGALAKLAMTKEFEFKAHTPEDAKKWHAVIASITGAVTNDLPESAPVSPATAQATDIATPTSATSTTATTGVIPGAAPVTTAQPVTTTAAATETAPAVHHA
ncbi:uncharacterized protein K489DRAFT_379533 [Dissoconium aciculare CBS 342.82]|jgi:hypothetical protein|uniref:PH domain-containing protein n=1 Tax=Dissoconium aciculare CBS 342.82 TaxID=1314786 RepID=A0A6J3M9P9_9PEZI|nr:uncharacterized protein K489DRAFT_379533 [Dissoconium aciculare CBS 342.82]KAF1823537.1 hypothetical protein K489DRAFT_379533 [Dissoconium aciculare CBS 342.82]